MIYERIKIEKLGTNLKCINWIAAITIPDVRLNA